MPQASNGKTLQDQAARDVIAQELGCNVMVFAGAGAGKTYALVQRMAALVRTGTCEADRMVAITFTRKAAGEMRVRFFLALREAAEDPSIDPKERRRIVAALDRIDQCFMGTIHSFCGRLIRTRPIEARLAPGFREVEGREATMLLRATWDRFVQRRYREQDPRLKGLREAGLVPDDLYAFFRDRCEYSDLALKETDTPKPDFQAPVAALRKFLDSEEISLAMPRDLGQQDKLMRAVQRGRDFLKNTGIGGDADAAEALSIFENLGRGSSSFVTLKHWSDPEKARLIRDDLFPAFRDEAAAPALRAWREYLYGLAAGFVEDAVAWSADQRLKEGKLTFQDLLLRAAALLRDNPSVREHLQNRYRVLFVDEFQDTDPVQAEIIFYLTGQETRERDWRKLTPRPGSLFLVGDDKQSIYRFRRADIAIGRFVRERILETGGQVAQLNTSFRSLGALCAWINAAFAPIFSIDSAPRQAAFEPLLAHRPDGSDLHGVRKMAIPKQERSARALVAQEDARRIVSFIAQALRGETPFQRQDEGPDALLDSPASPGDFLILTRTKGQLAAYMRALEEAGIPYDAAGGEGLGESEEVQTVATLLEAVLNPGNPVPFLAFLRGPLVGLSDDVLYAYREAGGVFYWNADNPEGLPGDVARRFREAKDALAHAEEVFTTLPPSAALQSVLAKSGYLTLAAVHPDGNAAFRAGNLIRLLALVQDWAAQGYPWGRIAEELRALAQPRSEYGVEQMSVEFGRSDVVRVMNVHQAKGLEAPVVFLADPKDTSYKRDPSRHVVRSDEGAYLSMPITKSWGPFLRQIVAQPCGWEADQEEEKLFGHAEEMRLLYVAATRAKNLLVVSEYDASGKGPWSPLNEALSKIPELESAAAPPDEAEPARPADGPGYAELLERARERVLRAKEASYALRSVTGEREQAAPAASRKGGRGVKYGRLVHQLFEEAVRGDLPDPPRERIRRMAEAINRGDADAELPWMDDALTSKDETDAADALDRFRKSALWGTLQRAREVYTEVPLAVSEGGETEGPVVVRGVIDLAYRDEAGWHIVDYKTDPAETEEEATAVKEQYQPQLEAYEAYWSRLTGAPVADAELWLAHGPKG